MNIAELLQIMLRKKWISLAGFMLPILITISVLLNMPAVYEGEVLLKMSKVKKSGWIEDPDTIPQRLKAIHPDIQNIEFFKGIMRILVNAGSPSQVLTSLEKIVDPLIKDHEIKFNKLKAEIQEKRKFILEMKAKINYFNNEKKKILDMANDELNNIRYGSEIRQPNSDNPANKGTFTPPSGEIQNIPTMTCKSFLLSTKKDILNELLNSEMKLINLTKDEAEIQKKSSDIDLARTRLLSPPTRPYKVKPRPVLYFALAFISSVFLSIFLPITVDFLRRQPPL